MAVNNKPADDAKAMTDEYIKGATIADIAAKYNHSEQEVVETVTKEPDVTTTVTQSQEDAKETVKKEK